MFKDFFHKKNSIQIEDVFSPLYGDIIPLADVPDPVFSQKLMGDGIAIIPKSGKVVSPVNGHIVQVFPTKHAIGIQSEKGLEILIHIGLETVELDGEGFDLLVNCDNSVKAGDPLINVDLENLKNNNKEIVSPMIITNMDKVLSIELGHMQETTWGEVLLNCKIK